MPRPRRLELPLLTCLLFSTFALPQQPAQMTPPSLIISSPAIAGPFNGTFLQGGIGLSKHLPDHSAIASATRDWSLTLWFKTSEPSPTVLLAGIGTPGEVFPRYLALRVGRPIFWAGGEDASHTLEGPTLLTSNEWHSLAISVDPNGTARLYADGTLAASGKLSLGPASSVLNLAAASSSFAHFGGLLAEVTLTARALATSDLAALSKPPTGLDNLPFEEGSKPWPVQTRAAAGLSAPQDPATLPHSLAPTQTPHAIPPLAGPDIPTGNELTLRRNWQLAYASDITAPGEQIATPAFDTSKWLAATVPGTVLTTLIDRGIYPDPDFGLNNMAIPESLARQSFWYRNTFTPPAAMKGRALHLTFHGINYRATIFLNGRPLGEIVGAFRHKSFDVTALLKPGQPNILAVRIDPPPHPGIPHEQSIAAGSGPNGGMMMLDGPTFGATEGWDWMPGIRDRNIGLWQDVTLTATGTVALEVPQIISKLITALPDPTHAAITLRVPLTNPSAATIRGTLEASFDDVHLTKFVSVPPGGTTLSLSPADFPQLTVANPHLWWPNGYGSPDLHTLTLTFRSKSGISDTRNDRFGIREITYELSAFDSHGHLRRVEVSPTTAELANSPAPVLQTHESFRETPGGWVPTLNPATENSPAVRDLTDLRSAPFLVLRVNGVRIAVKGGSWGMDDIRKRVSRDRLEPFFRLHREANVNMIRNWMGQDTEDTFYDLADEYGLLVWNDFWDSTQDYNLEPTDAALFLANASDVITRYRNHPSIAVWCGRNEGVPPPTINEGLARLIAEEDGTRYYSADSNKINLHDSGPYKYQEPEDYFTTLSRGFAVEVGLPSPPTLESFQAFLPKEDQWPISDAWAYHDWHQDGNGDVAGFMQTIVDEFGPPTSLADFDRMAQMLNYVGHRAVFEGMNAHLWSPNSGRLLWMTQPAWPSSVWQIFSHDYDTQASFYGVKKASEPIHIQMDLPDHGIIVVNNTQQPRSAVKTTARVFDLQGKLLFEKSATLTAAASAFTPALTLDLADPMHTSGVLLIKLTLTDSTGALLSDNFYWLAASKPAYQAMTAMSPASLTAIARAKISDKGEHQAVVTLTNAGPTPALALKLTLLDPATGLRILPAYYTDNYVSLLPGETTAITVSYPATSVKSAAFSLRGWNSTPQIITLTP